jgi:hypothetical protein
MVQLGHRWKFRNSKKTLAGCGTQTAGLAFGGSPGPPVHQATEEYDGSTWTTGGLNTARIDLGSSRNSNCWFSFWWCSNTCTYRSNRRI